MVVITNITLVILIYTPKILSIWLKIHIFLNIQIENKLRHVDLPCQSNIINKVWSWYRWSTTITQTFKYDFFFADLFYLHCFYYLFFKILSFQNLFVTISYVFRVFRFSFPENFLHFIINIFMIFKNRINFQKMVNFISFLIHLNSENI